MYVVYITFNAKTSSIRLLFRLFQIIQTLSLNDFKKRNAASKKRNKKKLMQFVAKLERTKILYLVVGPGSLRGKHFRSIEIVFLSHSHL